MSPPPVTISIALAALLCLLSAAAPQALAEQVFVDDLGDTLRWETPPERIISLSPSITEILFAIGVRGDTSPHRLVGATRFCDHPPEAREIRRVGGIVDPSLEAIRELSPDLVIVTRGNLLPFFDALDDLDIPRYALEANGGLEAIISAIGRLGRAVGRVRAADSLADAMRERIASLLSRTEGLGEAERPRVYFGTLEPPLWTAGPGSMVDDVITLAGGANIASDAPRPWVVYSLESVVAGRPQLFLGTFPSGERESTRARAVQILASEPGWKDTEMARAMRICLVEEDIMSRPGPRIVLAAEEVARCLHPELFPPGQVPEDRKMPGEGAAGRKSAAGGGR